MAHRHGTTVRRVVLGLILAMALFASGAAAQDYIYTNFKFGHVDHFLPASPCVTEGAAQPVVYDRSAWVFYTCTDGRVIARRFFHPNDDRSNTLNPPVVPAAPTTPTAPAACDATKQVGYTGLNECEWFARYPR